MLERWWVSESVDYLMVAFIVVIANFYSRADLQYITWQATRQWMSLLGETKESTWLIVHLELIHWGRGKMATILRGEFQMQFLEWQLLKLKRNFIEIFSIGPDWHMSALVTTMAWRRAGGKPLFKPMMIQFTDAYMPHLASMSIINVSCVHLTHNVNGTVFPVESTGSSSSL